jgi:hypothetical protein
LHEALNKDTSLVWEKLPDEFDAVNDIAMHESVADETEEEVDNQKDARVWVFRRLLTVGRSHLASRHWAISVWCLGAMPLRQTLEV